VEITVEAATAPAVAMPAFLIKSRRPLFSTVSFFSTAVLGSVTDF
jgi:hypothetical protein